MTLEFIDGNEAIARAAIRAGCDFFTSYPITPASSILHTMLELIPATGGIVLQAEDEIAAIGFCIGAAMAGRKVMTATSGPGISLYSENIGLAIMGETPMVIVDIQRQGPATGSATKGADGDIQFARWGTSGGLPIIALIPSSIEDAYALTFTAFNYAERFRTPVFLLGNKETCMTRETVDLDAILLPPKVDRKRALPDQKSYEPHYFDSPEEVPPIADFGGNFIARYTTSTHDKAAYLTGDPAVIQEMIDHYVAKIEREADEIALFEADLQKGAQTVVISYGITSRSASVAVSRARAEGSKISALVLKTLWPVPKAQIRRAMQGVRKVVVPEMNMGQYRLEIERLARSDVEVVGVNKMDTTLLSPEEIIDRGGLL